MRTRIRFRMMMKMSKYNSPGAGNLIHRPRFFVIFSRAIIFVARITVGGIESR